MTFRLPDKSERLRAIGQTCLRKLQYSVGFNVVGYYKALLEFYREVGFSEEAQWTAGRLEKIRLQEDLRVGVACAGVGRGTHPGFPE